METLFALFTAFKVVMLRNYSKIVGIVLKYVSWESKRSLASESILSEDINILFRTRKFVDISVLHLTFLITGSCIHVSMPIDLCWKAAIICSWT